MRAFFFLFLILAAHLWGAAETVLIRIDQSKTGKTSALHTSLEKTGAHISRTFPNLGWKLWEPPPGVSDIAFLSSLKGKFGIADACHSSHYSLCDTFPDDPQFLSRQWNLYSPSYPENDIDAQKAWDITTGTMEIVVVVIDSGIDTIAGMSGFCPSRCLKKPKSRPKSPAPL
jgi:hypothetical protein